MSVEVQNFPDGKLFLRYNLLGDLTQVRVPAPLAPAMTDGLWEHTCFEAFIAVAGDSDYREFNFSPSGQWAAYAFSDYRSRRDWAAGQAPCNNAVITGNRLHLEALIAADDLPPNPRRESFQLGLAAVLETVDGSRSYWALHHPDDARPDFHDRRGFVQSFHLGSPP